MLKKIFEILSVIVVSAGIYTFSKFLNTFSSIHVLVWGIVFLYGICGIALGLYYNKTRIIFTFIITTILLEISVLVLKPKLFQELSLFGFLCFAFTTGFFIAKRKSLSITLWGVLIIVAVFFTMKIYPEYMLNMRVPFEKELIDIKIENSLLNTNVITLEHNSADLKNIVKGKITLVDFYFADCPPCTIKRKALLKLKDAVNDDVQIILIDNGAIDSFTKFTTTNTDVLPVFYDSTGSWTKNLNIKSFPFELILDKQGKIKFVSLGFAQALDKVYIEKTLDKIKSISND